MQRGSADDVRTLVRSLVRIDSTNPALVPGGAGEGAIAGHVQTWARRRGLEIRRFERTPGRPSLLVRAPGSGGGPTLMLCGHLDTVGATGMPHPHAAREVEGRLHGRGAYDMKGGLAAALCACADVAGDGLRGDVVVAAVADEESESLGMLEVLGSVVPDAAIVCEPTDMAIGVAHKGCVWFDVEIAGVAAHGSRPDLGVDAILDAGPVLTALAGLNRALARRRHDLLGPASLHAGTISGGTERSTYPARCSLTVERRTLPAEALEHVERELHHVIETCRAADPQLRVSVETAVVRDAFGVSPDEAIVRALHEAYADVLGREPALVGLPYWADSALLAAAGVPTALLGPRGAGAHAADEWVDLESCAELADVLAATARGFCA